MKTELHLYIPKPCHENWDAMTPIAKGKFCSSCSKQVVDFSVLTDKQVLDYFKNTQENTCGRFHNDQLQRPLQESKTEKKKNWKWLLAGITTLIITSRLQAQEKDPTFPLGKVKIHEPIPADITVGVVYSKPIPIDTAVHVLPEVSVVSYPTKKCSELMGDIVVIQKINKKDTLSSYIRKVLDLSGIETNPVKIFPNPAAKNTSVTIALKNTGNYEIQLIDNAARLLHITEAKTISKQENIHFQLPENLLSGIYYIRMINKQTKKIYTDKLIVQ